MSSIFKNEIIFSSPKEDEIEITLFGPDYGESAILKLPDTGWFVIDSCRFAIGSSKVIPSLEYLKAHNANYIEAIILTHPHEDHYLGLAEIIKEYKGRIRYVCRYAAEGLREFKNYLVQQHIARLRNAHELANVFKAFEEAKNSGAWPKHLGELTPIINNPSTSVQVIALTPSGESVKRYTDNLYKAIVKVGQYVQPVPDQLHNLIASAIWISVGSVRIILGSDLEKGMDNLTGWYGVLANPNKPNLSVNVIKVAHHGSYSAFCKEAWDEHKANNLPIAILTPYVKGSNFLPKDADIKRLNEVASKVGVTSKIKYSNPKRVYSKEVMRLSESYMKNWYIKESQKELGLIRIRLNRDGVIREVTAIPPAYWM